MEYTFSVIYAIALAALAVALHWLSWRRADRNVRMPLALYTGAYFVTSFIGCAWYGLFGADVLEDLEYGLDLSVLRTTPGFTYWSILFAPLIIPPACALLVCRRRPPSEQPPAGPTHPLGIVPFCLVFAAFALYCLLRLNEHGYLGAIFLWQDFKGDYFSLISARSEMFQTLPGKFFGYVYMTLPALSQCALYQAVRTRRGLWLIMFAASFLTVAYLSLAVVQKSLIVLYMVFLGLALIELRVLRPWTVLLILVGLLLLLTALQSQFIDEWEIDQSLDLLIFRLASSTPYYLDIYPALEPYLGIDLGLSYLGLDTPPRDNIDVFNYMYPGVTWVQGNAGGPAHVRAYAQGGLVYALVTMLVIGLAICGTASLKRRVRGPISFTLYVQALACLYYMTQVALLDTFLTSYGFVWSLAAVVSLLAMSVLSGLRGGAARSPLLLGAARAQGLQMHR